MVLLLVGCRHVTKMKSCDCLVRKPPAVLPQVAGGPVTIKLMSPCLRLDKLVHEKNTSLNVKLLTRMTWLKLSIDF